MARLVKSPETAYGREAQTASRTWVSLSPRTGNNAPMQRGLGLMTLAILGSIAPVEARTLGHANDLQQRLHAASVTIDGAQCSGVLAEGPDLVFTAAHCVRGASHARLRFSSGTERTGWVVATDQAADQALLILEDPVDIEPLSLVRRRQIPGTILYFEGHLSRTAFQTLRLDRIGRCPSLPNLANALFTSVKGKPGDSGAPLVDRAGRVVGLVHGGARCHIATPAKSLVRLLDRALAPDDLRVTQRPASGCPSGNIC